MIGLRDDNDSPPAAPLPSRAPELAIEIFAEGGWLEDGLRLEHRPEQEQMARAVAAAMKADAPLLFEAGTGVGKSLAYLAPGIIHAVDQGRQLIVSTHTISLQEQIQDGDLPLCRRLFQSQAALAPYADFRSAVLVGKANYLCTTRLASALKDQRELFTSPEQRELQRVADWAATTRTGLRHELQPRPGDEVWDLVCADSSGCSRKYCDCTKCFYQVAKARCDAAHVLVVNHSLLFALIHVGAAQGERKARGVIRADDFVVLDEAHTVPEVATENFGLSLSNVGVERLLRSLYHPKKHKGFLVKIGTPEALLAVSDCLEAAVQFFAFVHDRLLATRPILRVREENFVEPLLDGPLALLIGHLGRIESKLPDGKVRSELNDKIARLVAYRNGIGQFLTLASEDHVYWAEIVGKRQSSVALRSAPVDVAPILREVLFGCQTSVVCTSATLAPGGEIAPFAARLGAGDARAEVVKSPFDFERHMRVYVAADIPLPSPKEARLSIAALADYVGFCTQRVRGGSLVLFTSYTDMRAVAAALEPVYREEKRPFFMQGESLSRSELARQMRALGNAVLFGTDSFWTGVDVPGDALAQVIITRLPFDPPTHPITEARMEAIAARGGNPFNELTLPDALIKFRQGVGRLIRTRTDRGVVTVLDSRVLAKPYGRLFLEALPRPGFEQLTLANREERFRPFA
ncbi:MAG TPA: helicase C-terminal domain-containing protein [Opitutaceae bacterium]|nr:helicase C-terminal domain-containing protein [Opitutaceae bacterium]